MAKKINTRKAETRSATTPAGKKASKKQGAGKAASAPKGGTAKKRATAPKKRRSSMTTMTRSPASLSFAPGLESMIGESPKLAQAASGLGEHVTFAAAPKTMCKEVLQEQRGRLGHRNIDDFRPDPAAMAVAVERMKQLGFDIQREGRFVITASGPARLVSDVLKIDLTIQARPRRTNLRATQNFAMSFEPPLPEDLYVAPRQSLTVRTQVSEAIDDFVFTPPPLLFALSATAPNRPWHGVDDASIRRILKVPPERTGKGVKVGIVDTGFYPHPYYAQNGFNYIPTPTPSAPNPQNDLNGHGTAIAYNIFSVAPEATVLGFQQTNPPQDALEEAADAGVDIISCSWGWDHEQSFPALEASIRSIVEEGKIVLFASGNGHRAWPGSMPDVISVGGVFSDAAGTLEASNYASGFTSDLYPDRKVPDISGLVGQKPRAIYILMPCPPGCELDRDLGGTAFPDKDETTKTDGWVGASGTSSATPQLAGIAALLVEKARAKGKTLNAAKVRTILQSTGVRVAKGNNAQGYPAVGHPNVAVGHGLADAGAALDQV